MSEYIKMNDELIYNYQKDIIDEKDKEIERLKAREKECINHYLVQCRYSSEMELRVIELACGIKEFKDILYSYGEILDSKLLQQMQEQLLKVLRKVDTKPNKPFIEIRKLKNRINDAIEELFDLKDMIYKPETREINFDVQRKISSIIKILGSDKE